MSAARRGARSNPFRSERIDSLCFRPQGTSWGELMSRLEMLRYRAAVVGAHGTGKTTLLDGLASRLADLDWGVRRVFLNTEARRPGRRELRRLAATLSPRDVLLLDGADLLAPGQLRGLCRATPHAGGLVVTSHVEGCLPTLHRTCTDLSLARELARELVPDSSSAPAPLVESLLERHRGNLREVWFALYEHWSAQAT